MAARLAFAFLLVLSTWILTTLARADPPVHTWYLPPTASASAPAPTGSATATTGEPPTPPPPSIGVPVDGAPSAAPPARAPADVEGGSTIVRTPGRVGLRYTLEGIEVRGNRTTLARVVLRYIPFRAGDTLDVDDKELELTRFRLLGTAFFRDVQLSLRRGTRRGYAVLVVDVTERNTIVVDDLWLGLSADAASNGNARPLTAYGGLAVSEANLAGTGVLLGGAIALADSQLALRSRIADKDFLRTGWTAEAELLYNAARDFFGNGDVLVSYGSSKIVAQDFALVSYKRFGGSVGAGHDLGISTQLFFNYRLEKIDASLPTAASDHRGLDIEPIDFYILPGSSILSTLRAAVVHDTRDQPVLPTRGDNVILTAEASLTPLGSDYAYAKLTARASHWMQLPWAGHVLRLEAYAGAIFGQAPLFEKFYVGDFTDFLPDRVLDLNFDRRPSPNFLGTDIVETRYGDYVAKINAEYRIPLYRGRRSIYGVDLFGAFGVFGIANPIDLTQHARGYSGFATVPMDLTFNLGLRIDTQAGGFVFGLSNFLGFIPVRGTDQGAAR